MLKLTSKQNCCGCTSCASICPKGCIAMMPDSEGFCYPQIDETKCINCGLCEKVCPLLHKPEQHEVLNVYGAKNSDDSVRFTSSSGGMFTLFAEWVLNNGGTVLGAELDENLQVRHTAVTDEAGLAKLRGSKYVQSKMTGVFKQFLNRCARCLTKENRCCSAACPARLPG